MSSCYFHSDYVRMGVLHVHITYIFISHSPLLRSLRLTAYVVKVFAMANNLVKVESYHVCDAVKFLIANKQRPNGVFIETGTVSLREMTVRTLI